MGYAQAPTVKCSSPTASGSFTSPVTFNCTGTSNGGGVGGWKVYQYGTSTVLSDFGGAKGTSVSTSVAFSAGTQKVTVQAWDATGANPGNIAISFNVTSVATTGDFTIVMLPDTQIYTKSFPATFPAQVQWAVDNMGTSWNVGALIGVGDIVDGYGTISQWDNAKQSYDIAKAANLPTFPAPGNHDYKFTDGSRCCDANFNNYFGPSYFSGKSWYLGSKDPGKNQNFYGEFDEGGQKYLVIVVEPWPRSAALTWAHTVAAQYPQDKVILVTHIYMDWHGDVGANNRHGLCDTDNKVSVSSISTGTPGMVATSDDHEGDDTWMAVRDIPNLWMILSGHVVNGSTSNAVGRRLDLGTNGNIVVSIYADYQSFTNGGNGYMRLLKIHPSTNTVDVTTYSPTLGTNLTDSGNQFTMVTAPSGITKTGVGTMKGKARDRDACTALSGVTINYSGGSTVTDSSGNYNLTNIPPGFYTMCAAKSGYQTLSAIVQVDDGLQANWKPYMVPGSGGATNCGSNPPPPPPPTGGTATFTSSLTKLTNNNTSMPDAWNTVNATSPSSYAYWANNDIPPWHHISDSTYKELLYTGNSTRVFTHLEVWWGTGSHPAIGYDSRDITQIRKQITELKLMGNHGVMPNWYGPDREPAATASLNIIDELVAQGKTTTMPDGTKDYFKFAWDYDTQSLDACSAALTTSACKDPSQYGFTAAELSNSNCAALSSTSTTYTVTGNKKTCYVTKHFVRDMAYSYVNFFQKGPYEKIGGRPMVTIFGYLDSGGTTPDWAYIQAMGAKYFQNPMYFVRQSGAFAKSYSSGGFCWEASNNGTADPYTLNTSYLSNFYSTGKSSGKIIVGCNGTSFNNALAGWGTPKELAPKCGQTQLGYADAIKNAGFSTTTQLPYTQVVTWNDHQEGSGQEPGTETCWRVSTTSTSQTTAQDGVPGLSGSTISWTINSVDPDGGGSNRAADATSRTIKEFRIWATDRVNDADGSFRMVKVLDGLSPTNQGSRSCYTITGNALPWTYTVDLSCYTSALGSGTYWFYVEMNGVVGMQNRFSSSTATSLAVTGTATNTSPTGHFDSASDASDNDPNVALNGTVSAIGWAADQEDGAPVTKVEVYGNSTLLGNATLSVSRPDVAGANNNPAWTNSGWTFSFPASQLSGGTGTFTMSAKVYDSTGAVTSLAGPQVTVTAINPIASLSVTPSNGALPLTVTADTSASTAPTGRTITARTIDWGDGVSEDIPAGLSTLTHTYGLSVGTFTVGLTITDSTGATGTATQVVSVVPPNTDFLTISTLTADARVYSPIRISAVASVKNGPVRTVQIYVDDVKVYEVFPNASPITLDKYVFASAKSKHDIKVVIFDNNFKTISQTVSVYVIDAK
jgi:hypothetical protein